MFLTLAYSNIFSTSLKLNQIWLRLIYLDLGFDFLKNDLGVLVRKKLVKNVSGFYYLSNLALDPSLEEVKKKRALKKIKETTPLVRLAQKLPWVVGLGITGSVAVGSAKKNDDVDFLIVTKPHFLWFTRFIFTWVAYRNGKRRSFAKEEKNNWCFNLWLTQESLSLPLEKRNLYTAYDLLQVKWLVTKNQLALYFLSQNRWAKQFLPHYFTYCWFKRQNEKHLKTENKFWQWFLVPVNFLSYFLQRVYMQRHLTNEQVGYKFAFFHPRDTKGLIYKRLRWVLRKLVNN